MSRKQKIKHMSSNELKEKLYSHFQKSGSLDPLKAQLRGKLVSELFKVAEPVYSDKFPNVSDFEKCVLPLQVCNWLVYDHLTRQNYQYSLSTFVTEAQLPYPEKFLTAGDVLGLLGLKNSADFENITMLYSQNNELGVLHSLLLAIIKTMFNVSNKHLSLDTNHHSADINNSEKILQNSKKDIQNFNQSKSDLADDTASQHLPHFKQVSIDKSFMTNDDARSQETSFFEQFQSFKEENEKEVQKMRHRLLDELENLHSQKRHVQLELENTKTELRKEKNKLVKEKEMLEEKEMLLEKELMNKFEMKLRNVESEFAEKIHFKDKEIESLKRKLSEKDEKLTYVEVELTSEKKNNSFMKQELNDLKNMNKIIQDKYSAVLDQNTNLLRKFENMSDYTLLKEELATKSREIVRLQNGIKDLCQKSETEKRKYVESVRNLENDLSMKESQFVQSKEEVDDTRNTFKKEQALWNKERKKILSEFKELKECYETAIQKLEEKDEEIENLHQTINMLNYKLTNNYINAVKSESIGLYQNYQRPKNSQNINSRALFTKRNTSIQQQSKKDYDSKFKFFSDTKSTYGSLKQEENTVQEKYSITFSTLPEHNKQSYSKNYNFLSLSKKPTNSYDAFSKPAFPSSSLNFDKNKFFDVTKNPHLLTDVRPMITHSIFPYKTSKQLGHQESISSFVTSSQVPNFDDTRVKDTWKVPESSDFSSFHKQYGFTEAKDYAASSSNTMRHRSSLNKESNTPEKSLHLSSQDKNVSEKYETVLNSKELSNEVAVHNDNESELQEKNEATKSLEMKESIGKNLFGVNDNVASQASEKSKTTSDQETVSNQNHALTSQAQKVLVDSSQNLHSATSKLVENEPEKNISVFVNLDDAWKKRSSVTSLSYRNDRISETNLTDRLDNLNSLVSVDRTTYTTKQHAIDRNFEKPVKIGSENIFNKSNENVLNESAEIIDNDSERISVGGTEHLQQNKGKDIDGSLYIENESLYDKSIRNVAGIDIRESNTIDTSNKLQILDKNTKSSNSSIETGLPLRETKGLSESFGKKNKEDEKTKKSDEEDNEKNSEKVGNVDSLSEQSELHMSCGSEAEQQKEDSDAW